MLFQYNYKKMVKLQLSTSADNS